MPLLLNKNPDEALEEIELHKNKLREMYAIETKEGFTAYKRDIYVRKMFMLLEIEKNIKVNLALFT